jgi:hypothetical protein
MIPKKFEFQGQRDEVSWYCIVLFCKKLDDHNDDRTHSHNRKQILEWISLFHHAFQFTMCFGPTNALVCNKTLIQMSQIKTLKITPRCFDHQLIIIRELLILVKITG